MFIQQPIRVRAVPVVEQLVPSLIDSTLNMHYTNRANELTNDVVQVLMLQFLNPVLLDDGSTQLDILLSVEAQSVDLFDYFLTSFIYQETTDSFSVISVE